MLEPGRIIIKIAGREAGKYAVIVENNEDGFVVITGPKDVTGVKRRKCNISHVEPTENTFDIKAKADDSLIEEQWKKSGLIEKLEIRVPIKRELKKEDTKKVREKK